MPHDPKISRFLVVYGVLTTLFCFYFIHLAKFQNKSCLPVTSPGITDLTDLAALGTQVNKTTEVEEILNTTVAKAPVSAEFPRRIWQTAITSAAGLGDDERKQIQTWITLNQKHRYEVMTKFSSESYVKEKFADKPEILETFLDLQDKMMRADLTKYLVLSGDGGVYCDLDTVLKQPIDNWIPHEFREKANLVVGVEYDVLDGGRWGDWTLDLQFASWAILAKPNHMVFDIALESGVRRLKALAKEQSKSVTDMKASYKEVLDSTGPALFTRSVFEGIQIQIEDPSFTWKNISGMKEPRLYGDVLILPINAFGSGQAHSNSGSPDDADALVHHLFAGSWKADHPFKDQMQKEEEEKKKKEKEGQ